MNLKRGKSPTFLLLLYDRTSPAYVPYIQLLSVSERFSSGHFVLCIAPILYLFDELFLWRLPGWNRVDG